MRGGEANDGEGVDIVPSRHVNDPRPLTVLRKTSFASNATPDDLRASALETGRLPSPAEPATEVVGDGKGDEAQAMAACKADELTSGAEEAARSPEQSLHRDVDLCVPTLSTSSAAENAGMIHEVETAQGDGDADSTKNVFEGDTTSELKLCLDRLMRHELSACIASSLTSSMRGSESSTLTRASEVDEADLLVEESGAYRAKTFLGLIVGGGARYSDHLASRNLDRCVKQALKPQTTSLTGSASNSESQLDEANDDARGKHGWSPGHSARSPFGVITRAAVQCCAKLAMMLLSLMLRTVSGGSSAKGTCLWLIVLCALVGCTNGGWKLGTSGQTCSDACTDAKSVCKASRTAGLVLDPFVFALAAAKTGTVPLPVDFCTPLPGTYGPIDMTGALKAAPLIAKVTPRYVGGPSCFRMAYVEFPNFGGSPSPAPTPPEEATHCGAALPSNWTKVDIGTFDIDIYEFQMSWRLCCCSSGNATNGSPKLMRDCPLSASDCGVGWYWDATEKKCMQSGWKTASSGSSCDIECGVTSGNSVCKAARMNRVNSDSEIKFVVAASGMQFIFMLFCIGDCFTISGTNDNAAAPFIDYGSASKIVFPIVNSNVSTCQSIANSDVSTRLCCCSSGGDATTDPGAVQLKRDCPISADDCGINFVWDDTTLSCVTNSITKSPTPTLSSTSPTSSAPSSAPSSATLSASPTTSGPTSATPTFAQTSVVPSSSPTPAPSNVPSIAPTSAPINELGTLDANTAAKTSPQEDDSLGIVLSIVGAVVGACVIISALALSAVTIMCVRQKKKKRLADELRMEVDPHVRDFSAANPFSNIVMTPPPALIDCSTASEGVDAGDENGIELQQIGNGSEEEEEEEEVLHLLPLLLLVTPPHGDENVVEPEEETEKTEEEPEPEEKKEESTKERKKKTNEDEEDTEGEASEEAPRFVRWRKRRPEGISIGEFLFNNSTETDDMLERIFEEHCSGAHGMLGVSTFARMIAKRAVGTGLAGNLHAIFTLRTAIAESSDERIDSASFAKAIRSIIERSPNGPAAKWILMEYRDIVDNDDSVDSPSSSHEVELSASDDEVDGEDGMAAGPLTMLGLLAPLSVGAAKEWYYEDDDDSSKLHGPFSLRKLQSWAQSGYFCVTMRVCTGPGSDHVLLGDALARAGLESEAAVEQTGEWFYTDVDDDSVLHGPFSLLKLQEWVDGGHFEVDEIVRSGRDGASVPLSTVLRIAEDGNAYTQAEFIEHFGGIEEWHGAAAVVRRDSDSSAEFSS